MYEQFFGMKQTPFVNSIPAKNLYASDGLTETLGRLKYVVAHRLFAVVTGDVG